MAAAIQGVGLGGPEVAGVAVGCVGAALFGGAGVSCGAVAIGCGSVVWGGSGGGRLPGGVWRAGRWWGLG